MSLTVCLSVWDTLTYPKGGGHLWAYLNWALGLRALGCRVIWLEAVAPDLPVPEVHALVGSLKKRLRPYGLEDSLALCSVGEEALPRDAAESCLTNYEADLLLSMQYRLSSKVVEAFRRSALVDIDPGLLQTWVRGGHIHLAAYDSYFSIGETVGRPEARFSDAGLNWLYTPPCVALDWWPPCREGKDAAFTTVSQWFANEWLQEAGESYRNDKRAGFLPFLDLPRHTNQPLELALCLGRGGEGEATALRERGWRVRDAHDVTATPWDYQRYIQASLGEFSCAKPSYSRLQTAWVSDRTLCYLASGKPAVVQHTGPSRLLPDAAGLFRFRDVAEAARCLEAAAADYERHSRLARALAEEHFDARKVIARVLERALD
jgi:hypothetical protein